MSNPFKVGDKFTASHSEEKGKVFTVLEVDKNLDGEFAEGGVVYTKGREIVWDFHQNLVKVESTFTVADIKQEINIRMVALKEAHWANPSGDCSYKAKYAALETILQFIEEKA